MAGMMIPMDLHFFWVETSNQPGTLKLKPSPKHVVHDEGSWATLCTETSFCDPLDCVNQKIMMVEPIKHGLQTQDFCQIIQVAADATTVFRDGSPDQPEKWWKKKRREVLFMRVLPCWFILFMVIPVTPWCAENVPFPKTAMIFAD